MSDGVHLGNFSCDDCHSRDNLSVYQTDDGQFNATCWGRCQSEGIAYKSNNKLAGFEVGGELGIEVVRKNSKRDKVKSKVKLKKKSKELKPISKDKIKQLLSDTSDSADGFRGIKDKWFQFYRTRFAFDEETGEVSDVYHPCTMGLDEKSNPKLMGYHRRIVLPEKDFRAYPAGSIGKECDLFGWFKCDPTKAKRIVICGGEMDVIAAKQMFEAYRLRRGKESIAPIDFVSGITGEGVVAEQLRINYDKIDLYDEIILDLDGDVAGMAAEKKILDVVPLHKTRVMRYAEKDANDMLNEGLESDYVRAIYNASRPEIAGIVSSLDLHDKIIESCSVSSIPLPPILRKANEMLSGGLPLGEIVNILAGSGVGKTTLVGEFTYFWIFNSPHKIGVLSYEAVAGQYGTRLLSRHIGVNILKIVDRDEEGNVLPTKKERIKFLTREDVTEKAQDLYATEDGDERFAMIDDRDEMTTIDAVKKKILQLIKANQVKVLIIDPITDLLDSMDISDQAAFCSWLKKMKSTGITFILVNHSRKSASGNKSASRGGELDEQDMMGTGALYRSGAVNIIVSRDKEADDEIDKHTTKVRITKNRDGAETGKADELYYEYKEAKLHNKEDWLKLNNGGY